MLGYVLHDEGYDVIEAADGEAAIVLLTQSPPDVMVLDLMMPNVDGFEVLRIRNERDLAPDTRVLVLTAKTGTDDAAAAWELGADEYLVKPVEPDRLLNVVKRAILPTGGDVLVVDDDEATRDIVARHLRRAGYSTIEARDGEEALLLARTERPAVVLVDLLMPGVDGFDVVEQLRGDPDVADVPIVVLTAKDMTAEDHRRLSGRIDALAQKGTFRQAELAETMRRLSDDVQEAT